MQTNTEQQAAQPTDAATGSGLLEEANAWLTAFARGLGRRDTGALASLFLAD